MSAEKMKQLQATLAKMEVTLNAIADVDLVNMAAESFFGIPVTSSVGEIVGHLAVINTKPMLNDPGRELIMRIFAARAGAELERKQAEAIIQRRTQPEQPAQILSLPLEPASFQDMNQDGLAGLKQAAIEVDGKQIWQLCQQISESDRHLAESLIELVNQFDFDAILNLLGE